MTFSQHLTPASKADLLSSTPDLALSSVEVQKYAMEVSQLVKNILNPLETANDNGAPINTGEKLVA